MLNFRKRNSAMLKSKKIARCFYSSAACRHIVLSIIRLGANCSNESVWSPWWWWERGGGLSSSGSLRGRRFSAKYGTGGGMWMGSVDPGTPGKWARGVVCFRQAVWRYQSNETITNAVCHIMTRLLIDMVTRYNKNQKHANIMKSEMPFHLFFFPSFQRHTSYGGLI